MFSKTAEISKFIKVSPVTVKVCHVGRQTDGRDESNAPFRNVANSPLILILMNLNIYQCCWYSLQLLSSSSSSFSSVSRPPFQLSSTSKLTTDYTQESFLVCRMYRFETSARRPPIVVVAILSSGTPRHSTLPLSATSLTVRCHSAVKPLSLFIRVGTHSQT